MSQTAINIAIDGYSSCGKSTLAKALAKNLGFVYVDSGAMYRCVTLYFIEHNIDLDYADQVAEALDALKIQFDNQRVFLNGQDCTEAIRSMQVSNSVSKVSALKEVRVKMVKLQQEMGLTVNLVMDGRDIGTTVFPDADLKLFMTADPMVRAERRFKELREKGTIVSIEEIIQNLEMRDYEDTHRKESPLIQASDAIVLDNTHISEQEQLSKVMDLLKSKNIA